MDYNRLIEKAGKYDVYISSGEEGSKNSGFVPLAELPAFKDLIGYFEGLVKTQEQNNNLILFHLENMGVSIENNEEQPFVLLLKQLEVHNTAINTIANVLKNKGMLE